MGTSSVAAVLHSSEKVNVALRRSKPEEVTFPTVAIGLGRTYASAARKPGVLPISDGVFDFCDEMEGVESLFFRVSGMTGDASVERLSEKAGEFLSTETVEALGVGPGTSELGSGWRGRGLSSSEKMERSSPFQRSPHSWLFWCRQPLCEAYYKISAYRSHV